MEAEHLSRLTRRYPVANRFGPRWALGVGAASGFAAAIVAIRVLMLLGDRDVTGQSVYLGPGSPSVRIVYKMNGGGVRGKVESGANATVALVPQNSLNDAAADYGWLYHCDQDGTFALTNLRPGTYFAWALNVSPVNLPAIEVLRGCLRTAFR
jgi:hypothetical protein